MNPIRKIYHFFNKLYNAYIIRTRNITIGSDYNITGRILVRGGKISIGDKFHCNSGTLHNIIGGDTRVNFVTKGNGSINIGNNVGISNSTFVSEVGITVEDNVTIGGGCKFYDTDFHSIQYMQRIDLPDNNYNVSPIKICEGAFIGAHCIVLKGSVIGKHSVIGAGSVIAGKIPDGEIWAGAPAKFIKNIEN